MDQKDSFMFRHHQRLNTQSRPFGGSNVSFMVSEIHRDHGRFIWIRFSKASIFHKSDPCTFTGVDSKGHLNLMVMAYVDDLIVSGKAQAIQTFTQEIQKTFNLKHVDYLTVNSPVEFLGRVIKVKKSGQITMEFPQKLIDSLLGLFDVKGKSTTNGVKIHQVPKEDQVQCEKGMHSKFRTAIGKLLWMSQLRDDIKFPVKELSRSLVNPQPVDFDNLVHLLKSIRLGTTFSSWSLKFPQQILRAHSSRDCIILRFRLGWMPKVSKVNQWFSHNIVFRQSFLYKSYSGISVTFQCGSRVVRDDSGISRFIGDQALHQGTKIRDSFKGCENHSQDGFFSGENDGLASRHFKEIKAFLSSSICGFRTFSVKESCHLKR